MSSRDKASPVRLPLRVILVLIIFACSLAVHFIAEGLISAEGQPMFELVEQGSHAHPIHEHSEDHFVLAFLGLSPVANLFLPALEMMAFHLPSLSISPLLPPPNY